MEPSPAARGPTEDENPAHQVTGTETVSESKPPPPEAEPDDLELVRRFNEGDEAAFNMIVHRYSSKILTLCTYFLKKEEEAYDVAQEVFMKVHRSLERFRGDSKLSTWMHTIAVNTCKNRLSFWKRLLARRKEYEASQDVLRVPWGPEDEVERSERARLVREQILALPEKYRLVVILKDLKGLPYEEIAQILDIREGTVKSRLHRAREQLAARLSPMLRSG